MVNQHVPAHPAFGVADEGMEREALTTLMIRFLIHIDFAFAHSSGPRSRADAVLRARSIEVSGVPALTRRRPYFVHEVSK